MLLVSRVNGDVRMAVRRAAGGKAGRGASLPGVRVEDGDAPPPPDALAAALAAPSPGNPGNPGDMAEAEDERIMTTDSGEVPAGSAGRDGGAGAAPPPSPRAGRCAGILAACSMVVAVLALLAVLAAPLWAPKIVANDAAAARTTTLGIAHLANAIASGRPFDTDIALVRAAIPNLGDDLDRVLAALHAYAPVGRPALPELQKAFNGQSSRLVVLKMTGKTDQDWLNWTAEKIASVVRLESMAAEVSNPEAARELEALRVAATAMRAGEVGQAVAAVDTLSPDSQQELAQWRVAAVRQVALDGYAADLRRLAEARVARGPVLVRPW